jgi:glycine cleavage system H protein
MLTATTAQLKKYTESHEWIELADNGKTGENSTFNKTPRPVGRLLTAQTAKIGISGHAAESLGDVIFVELPEADREVSPGEPVGAVESVKSASDVLSPVSGKVIRGNEALEHKAKLINESAEGDAWIAEIEVNDASEADGLMDPEAYKENVATE